jgi:transcriptional regulator with XRE-family HTH domain
MSMGKKIAQLREEVGLSQKALAKTLGVHFQSVGRWEREEGVPDATDLKKMAELFKVPTDYLLFDDVPRDGRVDIPDLHLLYQFEEASTLDEEKRTVIKQLLDAFLFKEKIEKIEKNMDKGKKTVRPSTKKVSTRPISAERPSSRKN